MRMPGVLVLLASLASGACETNGGHDGHAGAPDASDDRASAPAPAAPARPEGEGHEGHGTTSVPEGFSSFSVDAEQAASMGLKTAKVEERAFDRTLRTSGVVALDETRTSHVHAKVRGFIESVSADFVGKKVKAGSPLCTVYSQEVYAAELEYVTILEQVGSRPIPSGAFAAAEKAATQSLLAAARRRLLLWDVPEGEIARLERTREPRRTFTLVAPRSGIIVAKQALAGMYIDPSVELYVVSDTSRIWVLADVYGADVPWVKAGAKAKITFQGLGTEEREATVAFVPPTVQEATRTLQVRFELQNEGGRLRPGDFATVQMQLDLGRALSVPESAVIRTGSRDVVFVVHGQHIQPRAPRLGPLVGGYYRVEEGLSAGDAVAVGAQFLIDSESRLRATSTPGGAHAGH